jgi:type II restriction/modification system DNA methylase subunit YeeA
LPSTLTPHEFVARWQHSTLKEQAAAQSHFNDICALIGHPTPAEDDPSGERFTFEAGASKASGGQGRADVWKKGCFAWEYKGRHANLDKAYQQLLQYREALQNPPLLIVSDTDRIVIHTNFTNTVKRVYTLALNDLLQPDSLALLRAAFTNPESLRAPKTTEQVTQDAAMQFARIADNLRQYGADPHPTAHFLIRLLFCLVAEDIGILPNKLFSRLVKKSHKNVQTFSDQLRQLFAAMGTGGEFALEDIPHVNGGLFDDAVVIELDSDSVRILAQVSDLDWSSIEPSIFGTLFERSLDPSKRSQLGAHYTSRDDILLIVEPVLMAPLRRRWAEVQAQARALAAQRDAAATTTKRDRDRRAALHRQLQELLIGFAGDIAQTRVLDPACGSGNFLYVALRLLLDLEKEVITLASELGVGSFMPAVSPAQLYGIEVNPYAHELAQATIWIGYIQWMRENGFGFSEPILKPLQNIARMDAILAYDEEGKPFEPPWPPAEVIVGNPPFLGGKRLRSELGDQYVDALFTLYDGRVPREADLVCYWFEKTRAQIAEDRARRVGLLATQGIRGGANRTVLERIKQSGDIFWAQSDRNWILDGATVHVSMIGFDDGSAADRILDGQIVQRINPNLTAATDLTQARQLSENAGLSFIGPSPKAPFDIDLALAQEMLSAPPNPNHRFNSDVVRPVVSGIDIVQGSRQKWTIDFGLMALEEAALYEMPFEYVKEHVYPIRSNNRRAAYAQKWWQYAEARPGMRAALKGRSRFIATARVAKHRVFTWLRPAVLPNDQTVVFARDDDYFFGVLHSKVHELWARATGTQLREAESGFRYTTTTTFETFPFPWPPGQEPPDDPRVAAIAQAARELVEKRDAWLNPVGAAADDLKKRTLTNLYNQRPTWLALAHRQLDEAVLAAYGWPVTASDEEILEWLLALNGERAA